MTLQEIIDALDLKLATNPKDFTNIFPASGYASDLLSCVIAGAQNNDIWVTVQSHLNIVAVAALTNLSAIIISENALPDSTTIQKANEENVTVFLSAEDTYTINGKLWDLGLK